MNYNKEEIKNLRNAIAQADHEYYVLGKPTLSDAQYDRMYAEYAEIEKQFPELKDANSPTMRVGGEVLKSFEKTNHRTPLLSIDQKAKTIEALTKFYNDCGGEGTEILIQPKYDGLTINATYQNGNLIEGATRGNGYIGEVITENVRTIRSVPLSIDCEKTMEVRGEAILDLQSFTSNFAEEYSNPRNFIAGTMRQLDSKIVAQRKADIVFYDIGLCDVDFQTHTDVERLEWLKTKGFKVTPYIVVNNLKDLISTATSGMNGLIYQTDGFNVLHKNEICVGNIDNIVCDGLVMKVNDLKLREELGMTSKGPKWAFAYKFKSIQEKTILRKVTWQVGRTGKLTPVANFDSVNIGGTIVSRATLNNIDYINTLPAFTNEFNVKNNDKLYIEDTFIPLENITKCMFVYKENFPENATYVLIWTNDNAYCLSYSKSLKFLREVSKYQFETLECDFENKDLCLKIGDTIIIERSNDVIPRIVAIDFTKKDFSCKEEIKIPEVCPCCGALIEEKYPLHFCPNTHCSARVKSSIEQYASRDAMNIMGLGSSAVDMLVDNGFISSIYDIYTLAEKKEQIAAFDGYGEKKITKILEAIEKSKKQPLKAFIFGLGIEEVGKSMAKSLAEHYGSIEKLMASSKEELFQIEDVGEVVAKNIYDFITDDFNIELVNKLKDIGFSFEHNSTKVSNKLEGKTFVVTGTLKEKRKYYEKIIEDNGGKMAGSVSPKTYAVIIGEDAGSKETKARDLVAKGNSILLIEGHEAFENFMKQ